MIAGPNAYQQQTDPEYLEQLDRQERAIELRKAGLTYDEIARILNYSNRSGAYNAVKRAIEIQREAMRELARDVIELELDRLDTLHKAVWPRAIRGDLHAIDRVLSIMDRRAALLGLDAPQPVHGGDNGANNTMHAIIHTILNDTSLQAHVFALLDGLAALDVPTADLPIDTG